MRRAGYHSRAADLTRLTSKRSGRAMRIQAAVPEAFNLHAMEYVAMMMRFMPQARSNHKTAYELANGVPHRKPGPISRPFSGVSS